MIKRLISKISSDKNSDLTQTMTQWDLKNQHETNNINEIQLLEGHKDIIRLLIRLDEDR